jgi:hypothetical protein
MLSGFYQSTSAKEPTWRQSNTTRRLWPIDCSSTSALAFHVFCAQFYSSVDLPEAIAQIADHAAVLAIMITMVTTQYHMSIVLEHQRLSRCYHAIFRLHGHPDTPIQQ